MTGAGKNLADFCDPVSSNFFRATDEFAGFFLTVKKWVLSNQWSSSYQKTSVENTIPPLLKAYHVTRSVSRDKHKLKVMTSDDAFFFPSNFFSSTYMQCYLTT